MRRKKIKIKRETEERQRERERENGRERERGGDRADTNRDMTMVAEIPGSTTEIYIIH